MGIMPDQPAQLSMEHSPRLEGGTLVLAFTGWMDGGDVSTGTVERLIHLLDAQPFAQIDPEPFYIYNFPGAMEITALFRPHTRVEEGLVASVSMPQNLFFAHESDNLVFFVGKEPNLLWRTFGQCILHLVHEVGLRRILFVGSFGGTVPHTREPRLFCSCSHRRLIPEMQQYGLRPSTYEGPGSFINYLMTQAGQAQLEMVSLVAEIPGYLQGANPMSIEAVTRRLAKILKLPLDLDSLRVASTRWELEVSSVVEQDEELAEKVRELESRYDTELLDLNAEEV
ncbi:MAG: PAC2 family protein [Patescibacteria group bacterium]|nr:PAC2 family protein [Patescibacteria group bacterium]